MTLSVSNQASARYKLEGVYPLNFGVLQAGSGTIFNYTGETLDYALVNVRSKTIRTDRSVADIAQVDANGGGGFKVEQIFNDIDWFLAAVMQNDYVVFGTNGVSTAIASLTFSATTITAGVAPSGNDAWIPGLKAGAFFSIKPPVGATAAVIAYFAKAVFRVHPTTAVTNTIVTLDPATPVNTAVAGTTMVGGKLSTSKLYNGAAMKTFSIEMAHLDITQFRTYLGVAIDTVELTISSGAIVEMAVETKSRTFTLLQATSMGTPAAAQLFTPANATKGVMDVFEGGNLLSVITFIKNGKIKIANNLRTQEAVSVFGAAGIASGTFEVTGSMEMYFADATHYNKVLAGQASALAIPVVDVNGNGYTYSIPNMKYTAAKVNATGENVDLMLSVEFQAILDSTATNDTFGKSFAIYRH